MEQLIHSIDKPFVRQWNQFFNQKLFTQMHINFKYYRHGHQLLQFEIRKTIYLWNYITK
jgi:hypothetical protein